MGKGFLQNLQMGKSSNKDQNSDITYVRNLYAYIAVQTNLICLEAKTGRQVHPLMIQWIYFMWDTMMTRALLEFIKRDYIRKKLQFEIKENTVLNILHNYLKDGHLHDEMKSLIRINDNFYRFVFSSVIHIRYFNTREIHIQTKFLEDFGK